MNISADRGEARVRARWWWWWCNAREHDVPQARGGRRAQFPPLILRSRDYQNEAGALDVQRLKRDFGCNATVGTQGDGFEMGLESAKEALSPALLNGFNAGFLRPEAFLAIIFLLITRS